VVSQDASDVVITQISNSPVVGQGDQYTSIAGGVTFYIKGTGFDQYASNNYVFVGPYQATVLGTLFFLYFLHCNELYCEGVNDVFLIFQSVPMQQEVDMPVTVMVLNSQTQQKKSSICTTDCHIYYRWCTFSFLIF
jgi:hypothetical protein